VDVVPHEVRVQRRDGRRHEARTARDESTPELVDEQRGRDGDDDLREPDDDPRPPEDPVERDEEEAVQRLRVGGGPARDEAVRAAREERAREVGALVDVGGRDRAPLVEQDREARDRGERREQQV
jgi:hypothetical protein